MSINRFLYTIALISILSPALLASDLRYEPSEVIVRFSPKATGEQQTINERNAILSAVGGGVVKDSSKFVAGLTLIKLPKDVSVENAVKVFKNTGGILSAQPNYIYKAALTFPNDPNFSQLWSMHNTGQNGGSSDSDIDAPEAWDIETNANEIIVAVIDSGVDYSHPDLAANMWKNPGEIPDNGLDDDGNGYIDDIYGWNFRNDSNDPCDDFYHGTHCAGIVGAKGNNGAGVTGVCWNVKIMALKFLDYTGSGYSWDAIPCIYYAIDKGAKVLSNSWYGIYDDQELRDAIEAADANGILFVASAGNEGNNYDEYPYYPAGYDCNNIISVMATDENDVRSIWNNWQSSNWGATSVDLAAPGTDILSTFPTYETRVMAFRDYPTFYYTMSGTSMSTPHVAGACALVWSVNPRLSHLQVKDIILKSVDKLPSLDDMCVTEGRLNLYNALVEALKNEQILSLSDNISEGSSVLPNDEIAYTIHYANPVTNPSDPNYIGTLTNVTITDYLPVEVNVSNPNDPAYNDVNHTYTWDIGTLTPGSSDTVSLSVVVNNLAEPLGRIKNMCKMKSDQIRPVFATESADVNSWNPGIIYVNKVAPGLDTGMSWENGYRDLQKALARARIGCGSEIWVAAGTYKPAYDILGEYYTKTFEIVDGVSLYGHFTGFETSLDQRDLADANSETILYGYTDWGNCINHVITGQSINNSIIDGFTIQSAYSDGVYLDDCNVVFSHCKIKGNIYGNGISAQNASAPIIQNCTFIDNGYSGLYIQENSHPIVSNCIIQDNGNGIYSSYSTLTIKGSIIKYNYGNGIYTEDNTQDTIINNWIHDNYGCGIGFSNYYQASTPVVRNNTICNNIDCGIVLYFDAYPEIRNCIIYNNSWGDFYGTFSNVNYCCLQSEHLGEGNIWGDANDPNFIDGLHISANSPCRNTGDPEGDYGDETDIDGEGRIKYGRVDIGADEYYRSPDFDRSGTVDFKDLAILALAWLEENGEEGYNEICDLEDDDVINAGDLELFCDEWLWQSEGTAAYSQFGGEEGEETQNLKLKIQNYDDVKEILEWTDAIEAEIAKSAESSSLSADSAGSPQAEYKTFRQAIEKELLDMVKTTSDK